MSCDVGCRCSPDVALLWLWRGPAAAALIRPLAWELPYATPGAPKTNKKTKRKKKKRKEDKRSQKRKKNTERKRAEDKK